MNKLRIFFDDPQEFNLQNFRSLIGLTGLYFIFLTKTKIAYPFKKSRLIYIGMSEMRTNSIGTRLISHFEGQSGNKGIFNYRKVEPLNFTYINFEMLKKIWINKIEDLETYFILDFIENFGVYPICNNKTSFEVFKDKQVESKLIIDWEYFK